MSKQTEQIKQSLQPLFEKAEKEGLWFNIGTIWFSPAGLKEMISRNKYVWGPVNWELRDPEERLEQLAENVKKSTNELTAFCERMRTQSKINNHQS